jgi:hypothetical protein
VRINPQLKILGVSAYDGEGMARCPHFSIPWPDLRIFFAVASTFAAAVGRKMIK